MTPTDTAELERLADECRDMGNEAHQQPGASKYMRTLWKAEVLIREVLAHRKAEAWQPIETAPHETLVVLGWYEGDVWKQEIALASAGTRYPNGYSDRWQHGRASHWRPLPDPSTTPEAEGGSDAE